MITLIFKTLLLFFLTAVAEIVGCYLPYLWLRENKSVLLLIPASISLAIFVWLLSLYTTSAGRVYAAYGGVYVSTAILWLWLVEKQQPDRWDVLGCSVSIVGMLIIALAPRG